MEEARATLKVELENLATTILEDKSRRFTEQNREQIGQLLNPLAERLQEFRKQVSDAYGKENEARAALAAQVRMLGDLNQTVSREAHNLTQALKGGAKTRGNWGEMILESVLEKAGLVRGQTFHTQVSGTNSEGRRFQPDVVVDLPGNRQIIIDAKVSLNAYERMCSATDDEERKAAAKEHAESVRRHIEQLGQELRRPPRDHVTGFVFLFVPVEPALHAALETAPDLLEAALTRDDRAGHRAEHRRDLAPRRPNVEAGQPEPLRHPDRRAGRKLYDKLPRSAATSKPSASASGGPREATTTP